MLVVLMIKQFFSLLLFTFGITDIMFYFLSVANSIHGNLLFFDLRDHFGLTQCVTENNSNYFKEIEKIKPESVVCVSGTVVGRSKDWSSSFSAISSCSNLRRRIPAS